VAFSPPPPSQHVNAFIILEADRSGFKSNEMHRSTTSTTTITKSDKGVRGDRVSL
jgi:hypothetical protein